MFREMIEHNLVGNLETNHTAWDAFLAEVRIFILMFLSIGEHQLSTVDAID